MKYLWLTTRTTPLPISTLGLWRFMDKIFPAIIAALSFCAAGVFFCKGHIRMAVYWLSAGVLTTMIVLGDR